MIKIRRIYADWSLKDQEFLTLKGLSLSSGVGYGSFDIQEGELYNSLSSFLKKKRRKYFDSQIGTIFNEKEIDNSNYYAVFLPIKGYPQPMHDGSYRNLTFGEFYKSSGIKKIGQVNPFILKGEPKWKKEEVVFGLFWEYDAFFAKKEFYKNYLSPLGLDSREVLIDKKGKIGKSVVQVIIPYALSQLKIDKTIYDIGYVCPDSGIKKYSPQILDFLPAFKNPTKQKISLTKEIFGEGLIAYHKIIIDKEVLELFLKHKIIKEKTDVHPMQNIAF